MSTIDIDKFATDLPPEMQADLQQLRELDGEIKDLERSLNAAQQRRRTIFRRLELYSASRAPIRRVPNELLAVIFQQIPEDQQGRNSTLMLVCRTWHQIVMQTPRLWNEIRISLSQIEDLPRIWLYIHACIYHSGTMPLDIYIDTIGLYPMQPFERVRDLYHHDDGKYDTDIDYWSRSLGLEDLQNSSLFRESISACALFMLLAFLRGDADKFTARWRRLHIENPDEFHYGTLYHLWENLNDDGVFRHLDYLGFHGGGTKPSGWDPKPISTPNTLRSISTDLELSSGLVIGSFPHLEHLIFADPFSSAPFVEAASSLSTWKLETLQLWIHEADDSETAVHLPALQVLALSGRDHWKFIKRIKAPKLTHLSISAEPPLAYNCILNTVTDLHWYDPRAYERYLAKSLGTILSLTPSVMLLHTNCSIGELAVIAEALEAMRGKGGMSVELTDDKTRWPFVIPRNF